MEESLKPLKRDNYLLLRSTFLSSNKTLAKEAFLWMIWLHFQVSNTLLLYSYSQPSIYNDSKLLFVLFLITGGHTLGFSHCSSFQNRIHKFDKRHNVDPTLQASFAASLQNVCPAHNKVRNAGATMDSTTTLFDNAYYKLLMNGKSLFTSDESLLTDSRTKRLVSKYASSQDAFFKAFANSMIKMSSISGNGQEVRLDCRFVR